jgi:hypothetical protein
MDNWLSTRSWPKGTYPNFGVPNRASVGLSEQILGKVAKIYRIAGRALLVVAAAPDVYSIVKASDPLKRSVHVVTGWAGAGAACESPGQTLRDRWIHRPPVPRPLPPEEMFEDLGELEDVRAITRKKLIADALRKAMKAQQVNPCRDGPPNGDESPNRLPPPSSRARSDAGHPGAGGRALGLDLR